MICDNHETAVHVFFAPFPEQNIDLNQSPLFGSGPVDMLRLNAMDKCSIREACMHYTFLGCGFSLLQKRWQLIQIGPGKSGRCLFDDRNQPRLLIPFYFIG